MTISMESHPSIESEHFEGIKKVLSETLDEGAFFGSFIGFLEDYLRKEDFGVSFQETLFFRKNDDESYRLIQKNGEMRSSIKSVGPIGIVYKNKTPYISGNCSQDPLFRAFDEKCRKALIYPVIVDGEILGILYLRTMEENNKNFDYENLTSIGKFINSVEGALKNMQMYLSVKLMNEQLLRKIGKWDNQNAPELKVIKRYLSTIETATEEIAVGKSELFKETLDLVDRKSYTSGLILLQGAAGIGKTLMAKRIARQHRSSLTVIEIDKIIENTDALEIFDLIFDELSEIKSSKVLLIKGISKISQDRIEEAGSFLKKMGSQGNFTPIILHHESKHVEDYISKTNPDVIKLPELSERKEDIGVIARHFVSEKDGRKHISDQAIKALENYKWPKNIEELKEYMDCSYLMAFSKTIDTQHIPEIIKVKDPEGFNAGSNLEGEVNTTHYSNFASFEHGQINEADLTLASLEKRHIFLTLDMLKGNKTRAAKALGITVKTLYNKLHLYGIAIQQ